MLAKRDTMDAVDLLPDQVSPEQLANTLDRLLLVEETRQGLLEARAGNVVTAEEARRLLHR